MASGGASGGTTLDPPSPGAAAPGRAEAPPLLALTVLAHPDLDRIGDRVFLGELARGREARLSRQEPRLTAPAAPGPGEPLADPFLSRRPLRLEPLPGGGVRLRRDGSPIRIAVGGVVVEESRELSAAELDDGRVLELCERIALLLQRRPVPAAAPDPGGLLLGESAEIEEARRAVARAAPLDLPVLIRGETGTGK
jgi:two-component system nitrogen regulation response regulator GlnG